MGFPKNGDRVGIM